MNLELLICESKTSIKEVLEKIELNSKGICLVVKNNKLIGVVSDGDIRRGLINGITLNEEVQTIANKDFKYLKIGYKKYEVDEIFTEPINIIPIIDNSFVIKDFIERSDSINIPILEPYLLGNENEYVNNCLKTKWISSQGKYVSNFEQMFEQLHPNMNAVAVSSGTAALHLALLGLDVKEDDEVIIPNLTFAACINAIIYCKATPVLCEIDQDTWCIDPNEIEKLISNRTKVIMPVHLYGQACNMNKIIELSNKYNISILEDCAEAIGTKYQSKPVGTFGDSSIFSFFGNKTISTGEGGMVLLKDRNRAEYVRILRDHGMNPNKKYWHDVVGYNYRLTNIQAAIGVAQVEEIDLIINKKMKVASNYQEKLLNSRGIYKLPYISEDIHHSNWLYSIILDRSLDRNKVIIKLKEKGIDSRPIFYPLDEMPPYKFYPKSSSLDISKFISSHGLSLPSSAGLGEGEIEYVVDSLERILDSLINVS